MTTTTARKAILNEAEQCRAAAARMHDWAGRGALSEGTKELLAKARDLYLQAGQTGMAKWCERWLD